MQEPIFARCGRCCTGAGARVLIDLQDLAPSWPLDRPVVNTKTLKRFEASVQERDGLP
jgi:hypothetical protein